MKKDYSKWIGYILFVATLITWGVSYGKQSQKVESLVQSVQELTSVVMSQQQTIGGFIMYMELNDKED